MNVIKNEFIDKAKILLNPLILNPKKIHFNEEHIMHIHPHNHLTLHEGGAQVLLAIHKEYIRPTISNTKIELARGIHHLMEKEIVINPFDAISDFSTISQIFYFLPYFATHLSELELCFNFRKENVKIKEESIALGFLKKYVDLKTGTITYYSTDDEIKSMIAIYDKESKDIKDNNKNHKQILANPFKTRLEFRLNNKNCQWLNIDNLRGTYNDIINRFLPFISMRYNELIRNHVEINPVDNYYFKKLLNTADELLGKVRYRGNELMKSLTVPNELLKPFQIKDRDEKREEYFKIIVEKSQERKSIEKIHKIEKKLIKNDIK
jgi:hypothetical protein